MSFPFESLSLKLMKLLGEVGAEFFCLQGTMLCPSSGLEDGEKYPETETRAETGTWTGTSAETETATDGQQVRDRD